MGSRWAIIQLLLGVVLTNGVGCVAPNYVIDGPPGPSPEASIAICEACLRNQFASSRSRSEVSATPVIVFLKCDLNEADRASLMERLSDVPAEFRPAEEENDRVLRSGERFLSVGIRIKWIDYYSAEIALWRGDLSGAQGNGWHMDARYESDQWRFYFTHRVSTVN